jgi:siroheme synthase (precorrin-2 oxidase/ferrochelatase)
VTASTGGASPALAAWLRDRIADAVGPEFAALAEQLARCRRELRASGATTEDRDWGPAIEDGLRRLRQLDPSGHDGPLSPRG